MVLPCHSMRGEDDDRAHRASLLGDHKQESLRLRRASLQSVDSSAADADGDDALTMRVSRGSISLPWAERGGGCGRDGSRPASERRRPGGRGAGLSTAC